MKGSKSSQDQHDRSIAKMTTKGGGGDDGGDKYGGGGGTKEYDDDINKILGPNEKKIKKSMNKKLRKKYKQSKRQEEKVLMNRIGENDQKAYDFI